MVSRSKLISDLELRLTRGKVSDDFQVSRRQIGFWVDTSRDEIVSEYLNGFIKRALPIDPFYISRDECKLISFEDTDCVDDEDNCWERKKATLSGTPLHLIGDEGMVHITNNIGKEVHRVTHDDLDVLSKLRLSRPSQSKLVYHREDKDIIVGGLSSNFEGMPKLKVAYVRSIRDWDIADTEAYPIGENLVPELMERIEEIARRELAEQISFEDDVNDGNQE